MRCTKIILLLFAFLFIISGCATTPGEPEKKVLTQNADFSESEYAKFWNTWPDGNTPVFLGTAKRSSNREEERNKALISAAIRAVIYDSIEGLSQAYTKQSSMGSARVEDFHLDYTGLSAETLVSLVNNFEVIRELQDNKGTYILVRHKDGAELKLPSKLSVNLDPEKWINTPPKISGYKVSVGAVRQSRHPSDSIQAADELALEEMIKSISMEIVSKTGSVMSDAGSGEVQTILEVAEASIKGFYIIARYVSPDGKQYYSLGICPEDKN